MLSKRNNMKPCCLVPIKVTYTLVLTLSQTSLGFYMSAIQVLENTVGKGEIARKEQFLLLP